MKKIVLVLLLLSACVPALRAQLSPAYTARLQTVFDSVCQRYNIKGASAAVLVPGQGTWEGVWGISHVGQPITKDMLFGIGSNTKTYVSALMLKLQEQSLLSVDDTIGKWIQNVPNVNGQITIRQLLNHTSGLYNYTNNNDFYDSLNDDYLRIWQPEEILQFVKAPLFAPGANWNYSNTNYLLAGLIIKAVMNQPFEATLRSKILVPQQLGHTVFFPHEAANGPVPHPWYYDGTSLDDMTGLGYDNTANFSLAYTAGAIMATATDNVLFWNKLISGQIISPASFGQMTQTVPVTASISYGLGIFRYKSFNGHTIYSHGGTNIGYINENLADSVSGVCISVLTNQDSIDNDILLGSVIRALHRVTINPPTAVAGVASANGIRVYPNPATDYLHISGSNGMAVQCGLYDAAGRLVLNTDVPGNGYIRLPDVPAGLYLLRLVSGTGVQTQPVQVVK